MAGNQKRGDHSMLDIAQPYAAHIEAQVSTDKRLMAGRCVARL